MLTDIGQKRDISKEYPEEKKRLEEIANDWKKNFLDRMPRPDVERFSVGYTGAPLTELPARDGYGGGVVHSGRAPNCSFFTNWKNTEVLVWDVDVPMRVCMLQNLVHMPCRRCGVDHSTVLWRKPDYNQRLHPGSAGLVATALTAAVRLC